VARHVTTTMGTTTTMATTVVENVTTTVRDVVTALVNVTTTTQPDTSFMFTPVMAEITTTTEFPDFEDNFGDDPFTPNYTSTTPAPLVPGTKSDATWEWLNDPSDLSMMAVIMLMGELH